MRSKRARSDSGIPDTSRRRGFIRSLFRGRRGYVVTEPRVVRLSLVLAAVTGGTYGFGAYRGFGEAGVTAFVALVAVAAVVLAVGGEALGRAVEHGTGTPERRMFARLALVMVVVPPTAVWLAVTYLGLYGLWGPFRNETTPSVAWGILFGLVAAALGWAVLAAAITPVLALVARRRRPAGVDAEPPGGASGVLAPWPNTFTAPDGDPYANDAFEREQDVRRFCRLLAAGTSPAIWALTGSWGSGKSAFARMAAAECRRAPDVARAIEVNVASARVTGSALRDLVAAIAHRLAPLTVADPPAGISRLVDLAGAASEPRRLSAELIAGTDPSGTLDELVAELRAQVAASGGRVVLFLDDLDRCPPDYVLEMLHTVRTVTECRGLVTVLVLNRDAVEQAVRHHQGVGESSEEYLRRFIDVAVDLPPLGREPGDEWSLRQVWVERMAENLGLWGLLAGDDVARSTLLGVAWEKGVSLRDLEQIVYRTAVCFGEFGDPPEPSEEAPNPGARPDLPPQPTESMAATRGPREPVDPWHETARAFLGLIVLNLRGEAAKSKALAKVRSGELLRDYELFGSHGQRQGPLRYPPHLGYDRQVGAALRAVWVPPSGDDRLDLEALDRLAAQVAPPLAGSHPPSTTPTSDKPHS